MKKNKLGFTLIELLVAIAIVGILAGVVLVSMSSFGSKSRRTKAMQTVQSTLPAIMQCYLKGATFNGYIIHDTPGDCYSIPGNAAPCSGSNFILPQISNVCKTADRYLVYNKNANGGNKDATDGSGCWAASVVLLCGNESPKFYVRCWYDGNKAGKCETRDWGIYQCN